MNLKFKEQHLFEIEIFCIFINVFIVTCDQCWEGYFGK